MFVSAVSPRGSALSFPLLVLGMAAALALGGCVTEVVAPPQYSNYPDYAGTTTGDVDTGAPAAEAEEPPPALPLYDQPPCPGDGYLWVPGYWAYAGGYYWVPGTWVMPPAVGLLWTPGYWGVVGGAYAWHAGYWGPHVGFYGGVDYGFGYTGVGFVGGRWAGNTFAYNRSVTNIDVSVVHNTYNQTVINNVTVNRVSYNGGAGGLRAVPSGEERMWARESRFGATGAQQEHVLGAQRNPAFFARENGGHPAIAATPRPSAFYAPGIVHSRGAQQGGEADRRSFEAPHGEFNGQPRGQFNGQQRPEFNGQPRGQFNGQQRPEFNGQPRGQFNAQQRPEFNGQPRGQFNGQRGAAPSEMPRRVERPQQPPGERGPAPRNGGGQPSRKKGEERGGDR
jgi:WXXGXW repeat (2 copies)